MADPAPTPPTEGRGRGCADRVYMFLILWKTEENLVYGGRPFSQKVSNFVLIIINLAVDLNSEDIVRNIMSGVRLDLHYVHILHKLINILKSVSKYIKLVIGLGLSIMLPHNA